MPNFGKQYQSKLVTPAQAVQVVRSGDWVDYGAFAGQNVVLDQALAARKHELRDVKVRSMMRFSKPAILEVDPLGEHFTYSSWHLSGVERRLADQGLCYYDPMLFHELPSYYENLLNVDVAMLQVTPMNEHGYFNFGPQASHCDALCAKAKTVIVEVNPNQPWCLGGRGETIHISQVDYVVEANTPIPQIPSAEPTELDQKIAAMIMEEIHDGSCLQLGVGGMPNAIGMMIAKSDLKDLGIHTEMFVDSMVDMIESGRVNGTRKQIDKGKIVYTFAVGTPKTYDFLNNNPMTAISSVDYVNDPCVIAQNDNFVAINNCVEVDLFGQVCSESSGTRQISGTGGQVCYIYGSYRSKGGKPFICMTSSFEKKGDLISRVKPILTPGATVTTPRTMASYLVTEQGIVNLKGKSTWERAEAIISLAHPAFREELIHSAENMGIWRRHNKRESLAG
ncbi:MAG: butyryl-CoA:acetate CoA-transferase [Peptococcaceae bacterium]|nr:butyryl-CoA:acetate CoA-transferase [Peptococcaceae bacterium]